MNTMIMHYLTSFRGIAAVLVMLYHVRIFIPENSSLGFINTISSKGYLAVDYFFMLSGFIIAYRYSTWFQEGKYNHFRTYLVRRFARIYPLHVLFIFVYLGILIVYVITSRDVPEQFSASSFIVKLLLLDLWLIGTDYWNHWNVPSWTISGELLAYLLFPFMVRLLQGSPVRLGFFVFVICCLIAGLYEAFGYRSLGDGIGVLGIFRCLFEFSLGILAFRVFESKAVVRFPFVWFLGLSCVAVLFSFISMKNHVYIPILFFGILVSSLYLSESVKRYLENKVLIWLGNISFSVYLGHTVILYIFVLAMPSSEVIFEARHVLLYITAVLLVSHITFHWVEVPGRSFIGNRLKSDIA